MNAPRFMPRCRHGAVASLIVALGPLGGCGGGDTATDFKLSAAARPDLDAAQADSGGMRVPGDAAFNIRQFTSEKSGENAAGESIPSSENGADCRARATGEGMAEGEFLLGYSFDNRTNTTLYAMVRVRLLATDLLQVTGAEEPKSDVGQPAAESELSFLIKDSNGAVIKSESLLLNQWGQGPSAGTNSTERVFDARLQPDLGYYFILRGHTKVISVPGSEASASLEVRDCQLELQWDRRPADAPAAGTP